MGQLYNKGYDFVTKMSIQESFKSLVPIKEVSDGENFLPADDGTQNCVPLIFGADNT